MLLRQTTPESEPPGSNRELVPILDHRHHMSDLLAHGWCGSVPMPFLQTCPIPDQHYVPVLKLGLTWFRVQKVGTPDFKPRLDEAWGLRATLFLSPESHDMHKVQRLW